MEKQIKIKTSGNKYIYGVLRFPEGITSKNIFNEKPLVIFVHGLTGHKNEHHFFNGARFFTEHGWLAFRFDLYGDENHSRHLQDCTIETHAGDLDSVIDYFKNRGVSKIFVAGHSYGGLTILMSKKKRYDAAALWDTSYAPSFKNAKYVKEILSYVEDWGVAFVFSKDMMEEAKQLTSEKCDGLIKSLKVPVKIIVAGKGELISGGRKYFKAANEPKSFTIIKNATHCFDEDGTEEQLFQATYGWFSRFK